MSFLVDTCVLSEAVKRRPADCVVQWLLSVQDSLYISVLTIGEIQRGLVLSETDFLRTQREEWLRELLFAHRERILPVTTDIAKTWGQVSGQCQKEGHIRPQVDCLLAATAICHDLTIATRNEADFEWTNAKVLNPWKVTAC